MLSGDEAYERVKKGTQKAAKLYEEWACGTWLSDAGVESVIQTEIARALYNSKKCYVTLETSLKHAVEWDKAFQKFELRKDAKEKFLSKGLRFDICVWSKNHKLTGIIEVKRSKEAYQLNKDMIRMREMILATRDKKNDDVSLRYTMVAMYLWASSDKELENVVQRTKDKFYNIVKNVKGGETSSDFNYFPIKSLEETNFKQCIAIAYFS